MIFDILEQTDLFQIAKCGRESTLRRWLDFNRIPFTHDAKGQIIVHRKALEAGLGVAMEPEKKIKPKFELNLELAHVPQKPAQRKQATA